MSIKELGLVVPNLNCGRCKQLEDEIKDLRKLLDRQDELLTKAQGAISNRASRRRAARRSNRMRGAGVTKKR